MQYASKVGKYHHVADYNILTGNLRHKVYEKIGSKLQVNELILKRNRSYTYMRSNIFLCVSYSISAELNVNTRALPSQLLYSHTADSRL